MITLPARYCDGDVLRSHAVELHLLPDGSFQVLGEQLDRHVPRASARISDRLGSLPRFIRIGGGGVVELPDGPEFNTWIESTGPRPASALALHWLESRALAAVIATVLVVAAAGMGFWQGLPWLAHRGAHAVSPEIEQQAGRAAFAIFAQSFGRTQLSFNDQMHVRRALEKLTAADPPHVAPTLHFLQMGTPNAFALPGGILIVTDELYHLAANDDEIAAVLAHELGHVEKRHGLQSVLRNSTALILVSTLTGDLSTLSSFSATLPFLLLQFGYAREFEREADAFAAQLLAKAGIDPVHLARILERLDESRPSDGADFSYLSTHPPTAERLDALRAPPLAPPPPPP